MSLDNAHIVTQEEDISTVSNQPTMTAFLSPAISEHHSPSIHPFFLPKKSNPKKPPIKKSCYVRGYFRNGKFVNGHTRRITKKVSSPPSKSQQRVHVDPQLFILQHSLNVKEFKSKTP